jgi:hypothetical protein
MARARTSDVLWPLGASQLFVPVPKVGLAEINFEFDTAGQVYFLQELLAQGATGYRTIGSTAKTHDLPGVSKLIRNADDNCEIESRARLLLTPVAASFGLDGGQLAPVDGAVSRTLGYAMTLSGDDRATWSQIALVYNSVYQLLVGLHYSAQIDIPVRLTALHLRHLLDRCQKARPGFILATLHAVMLSYKPFTVSAPVVPATQASSVDANWVENFREYVEDEVYLEYAQARSEMGWLKKQKAIAARMAVLARRVARADAFRGLFKVGQRVTKVITTLPVDAVDLDPLLRNDRFLPSVLSLNEAMIRARSRWSSSNEDSSSISLQIDGFEWLTQRFYERGAVEIRVDRNAFLDRYQVSGGAEPTKGSELTNAQAQEMLMALVRSNLSSPVECDIHEAAIGAKDIRIKWSGSTIGFEIDICCVKAGRIASAAMCSGLANLTFRLAEDV